MTPKQFVPFFVLICLGLILGLDAVYEVWLPKAYADYIPYIGVIIEDKEPLVCIYEPPNVNINFTSRKLLGETYSAITEWEDRLTDAAPKGKWHFNIHYYLKEEHQDKDVPDYPDCNVYIIFNQFSNKTSRMGVTGFDYSHSNHKYSFIEIITDKREFKLQMLENSNKTNINATVGVQERPLATFIVGQIVKHEMGHALGLDHYIDNTFLNMSSDLMKPAMNDRVYDPKFGITDADIKAIIALYGSDGFGGQTPGRPDSYQIQ